MEEIPCCIPAGFMQIEDSTILLAPGALHLPLYQKILQERGSSLNVTVLTLEAYLSRALSREKPSTASLLYSYAQALEDLPEDNTFYASRKDYDFLKDCLDFMTLVQLYDLREFPEEDQRDRDLLQIIERLLPIDLWVREARSLPYPDAGQVRILLCETNVLQQYFVDLLLSKGAKMIAPKAHERFYYLSASNPRKEMEAVADAIVSNSLDASQCMIALSDPKERYVLAQALNSRKIPHTFASSITNTRVIECFQAAFGYIMDHSAQNLMKLLSVLYPESSQDIRRYLQLFGQADTDLAHLPYEDNTLISPEDFEKLQSLEAAALMWKPTLQAVRSWTEKSFIEIQEAIQAGIDHPQPEDIKAMEGVRDSYEKIRGFLHSPADLGIFIRSLDALHPSSALRELEGVLIGGREEVSCLHENVFYIGADAQAFPGSVNRRGVFGEEYVARLDFPSLEQRASEHLEQIKSIFMQPEGVWFLIAQSDYLGKNIEPSHDLNQWIGILPKFKAVPETSLNLRPSFSMKGIRSQSLYPSQNSVLMTKTKALRTFEDCPLKNLLQFGLHLSTPPKPREYLRIDGRIVPAMMRRGLHAFGRPFWMLSREDILSLVRQDFSFAAKVFRQDERVIDQLALQTADRLHSLFARIAPLCTEMNMQLAEGVYTVNRQEEIDGVAMEIQGPLGKGSKKNASFNLYPDTSGFSLDQPAASLDLSLQPKPETRQAFVLSYGRGAAPVIAAPQSLELTAAKGKEHFLKDALVAQNFEAGVGELQDLLIRKVPTYQAREDRLLEQAHDYAKALDDNSFHPLHRPSACTYCSYRAICRNAAVEKGEQA